VKGKYKRVGGSDSAKGCLSQPAYAQNTERKEASVRNTSLKKKLNQRKSVLKGGGGWHTTHGKKEVSNPEKNNTQTKKTKKGKGGGKKGRLACKRLAIPRGGGAKKKTP